jgi:FkbM family methyltransferase
MEAYDWEKPYKLIKGRHGWFLANPNDVYVGLALACYGEYGEIEWQMLRQLMPAHKDAIEIGANVGSHTVSMAKQLARTGRRLLAVEPQPVVFQNLCANLALNGLFNVVAENAACSDQTGWLTFQSPDYLVRGNFGGVAMREDGIGDQRVRAVRLDDLLPANFTVGLIKVDVEGFEQKVLEGAVETISRFRPIIYLENDRRNRSKALIEWLWAANYKLWWHVVPLFNPENFAGLAENAYSEVGSINMLALPNEAQVAVENLQAVTSSDEFPAMKGIGEPPAAEGA